MAVWVKMERKRSEMKDECVYKTRHVGFRYFQMGKCPEPYVRDAEGLIWVNTNDSPIIQKDDPNSSVSVE